MISSVLLLAVFLLPGATPQPIPPPAEISPDGLSNFGDPPRNSTDAILGEPPSVQPPTSEPPLIEPSLSSPPLTATSPPSESLEGFGLPIQGQACDQVVSEVIPRQRAGNASVCYTECRDRTACRFFQVETDEGCTMYSKCIRMNSLNPSTLIYERQDTGMAEAQSSSQRWQSATYALLVLAVILVTINIALFCHILLRRHKAKSAAHGGSSALEKVALRTNPGSFSMPMAPQMHAANTRDSYAVNMAVPMAPVPQTTRSTGVAPRKAPFAGVFASLWRRLKSSPPEPPPPPESTTSLSRFEAPKAPATQNGEFLMKGCAMGALRILTPPGNWSLQSAFEAELKACCPPDSKDFKVHNVVAFAVTDETLDQDLVISLQNMDAALLSGDGRTALVLVHTRSPDEAVLPFGQNPLEDAHPLLTGTYGLKCVDMYRWEGDFSCHRTANKSAVHDLLCARVPAPAVEAALPAEDPSMRDDTLDLFDTPSDEDFGIGKNMPTRFSPFSARNVGKSLPFTPMERVAEGSREYLSSSSLQSSM